MELADVRNIGPKTLEKLNAYDIYTPTDLLLFFPKRYYFYEVDNAHAFSGEVVCFKATLVSRPALIKTRGHAKAFVFYALVNGYKTKCIIFSGDYLRFKLQINMEIIGYGKYKHKEREFSLSNIFFDDFTCKVELDYGFKDINNKLISNAVLATIKSGFKVPDELPSLYINKYKLLNIDDLIYLAHFPRTKEDCLKVNRRVRYEDFFWYTASLEGLRLLRGFEQKTPKIYDYNLINNLIAKLPYSLTVDQEQALNEILNDLNNSKIMNRLIEGDVGCGKSIVAFLAAIASISAGYQVALMAPTEILANQHYLNFKKLFPNFQVELLTSSVKESNKREILYKLLHKRVDLIIGTHALIQENVVFSKLGLIIIDEQHRFGVRQRKALIDKFKNVDCLYLTATPIPRTLGLTSFGDLDLSLIKTKPAKRKDVITKIVSKDGLEVLGPILNKHLALGEQIYVVVPLITENENLDYIDINAAYDFFAELLPKSHLAKLHGKMKAADKNAIMADFTAGKINCLISTTVIEVGVDVKNATVMVILDAERYGLSQIHQLRGRVGRSDIQAYCYLVSSKDNVERLAILERTSDGFLLAEEDFKLRGPGDYLGDEQSGFQSLNIDFNSKDVIIWKCAQEDSREFVAQYLNGVVDNAKLSNILAKINSKKTKIN